MRRFHTIRHTFLHLFKKMGNQPSNTRRPSSNIGPKRIYYQPDTKVLMGSHGIQCLHSRCVYCGRWFEGSNGFNCHTNCSRK